MYHTGSTGTGVTVACMGFDCNVVLGYDHGI